MDCVTHGPQRYIVVDQAAIDAYFQADHEALLERLQTLGMIVAKAAQMDRVLEQALCA
jgi:hypothetical protein